MSSPMHASEAVAKQFQSSARRKRRYAAMDDVENLCDLQNLERLQRTCRAFGAELRLVQDDGTRRQDSRCRKSLDLGGYAPSIRVFHTTTECAKELGAEGARSFATALDKESVSIYNLRFERDRRLALWFGQEKHGLSDAAIAAADERVYIPMAGMVQSLNVAVSAAVVLAEVARQARSEAAPIESRVLSTSAGGDPVPKSASRTEKFWSIAQKRQRGLVVVLEDPDRLDAAAILRGCDAFGVAEVHFIFESTKFFDPLANRQVMKSEGSNLWVCSRVFYKARDCLQHLNERGFTPVLLNPDPRQPAEMALQSDLGQEQKLALWLCSPSTASTAGELLSGACSIGLPGAGEAMAVSNFVSVILAEVVRQRSKCPASHWRLTPEEQLSYVNWCTAVHAKRHPSVQQPQLQESMSPEYQRMGCLRAELARQGW
ncbi:unnamed protein product [Durusdinium trenchii]|uniref:tRNA/rRNA methyltransferase SpoU type domain-containing protein n=1 Tax=Durusdinium trenchii TaxID=1381693 RepID=A0ABP0LQP9_9DINO